MALRMSFIYVALLALLLTLVKCRESYPYRHLDGFLKLRDDTPPDYDPSEDPPPCFTLCGVVAIDSNAKRSLCMRGSVTCATLEERSLGMILPGDGDNSTAQFDLAKRTLPGVDGNTVDQYMVDITDGNAPAGTATQYFVWDNTDPSRHDDGLNTAMWQPFGTTPFNMVTKYIHGCTVICVWSRKGAWCSHYWQYKSFSRQSGYPSPNFNLQLLNAILGTGTNQVAGPTLASLAAQFTISATDPDAQKNRVYAAIMSPRRWNGGPGTFQYATRINQIKAAINQVIPALAVADIAAYDYVPVDAAPHEEDEPATDLDSTARGRVAFQYDPNADGQGSKGTRLLYERGDQPGKNLFEDIWTQNPS
ncbi:hypothetical protein B0A55_12755 [Friedmanniomyces simplex]|uniref:Uncharacterized protein n=1 Tax=Friedmanniomyces simplex TaxID=329884 RepID=A0A4U0VXS4_9PEZI|nr:hypothetical protein B0A55_12755 [Friedmanniomyces simplex]